MNNSEELVEQRVFRYLLGELSDKEMAEIERLYFVDPVFFEFVRATEMDLVRRFVTNGLTDTERLAMEQRIKQIPKLKKDVEFTRALLSIVGNDSAARRELKPAFSYRLSAVTAFQQRLFRWGWIVAILLLLIVVGMGFQQIRLSRANETMVHKLEMERTAQGSQPFVLAMVLHPGTSRDTADKPAIAKIGTNVRLLRLEAIIPSKVPAGGVSGELRTVDQAEPVWTGKDLRIIDFQGKNAVEVEIDPHLIKTEDYVLTLTASLDKQVMARYVISVR
jgi:hypothetical protein